MSPGQLLGRRAEGSPDPMATSLRRGECCPWGADTPGSSDGQNGWDSGTAGRGRLSPRWSRAVSARQGWGKAWAQGEELCSCVLKLG